MSNFPMIAASSTFVYKFFISHVAWMPDESGLFLIAEVPEKPPQIMFHQIAPPNGPNATLNKRTKAMVNFSLQRGDIEGASKAIDQASAQLGTIEKDVAVATSPQIQQGKIQVATAEGQARANVELAAARFECGTGQGS